MNTKISAVFPVMNRNDHVSQVLPSWIASDLVDEIVLVDWSSTLAIHEDILCEDICKNEKVRIIRVENEKFFLSPSFALNLGIDMCRYDNILKLDIDYKLVNLNLLKILERNARPGHFFCGTVPEKELNCYWGFAFFHRKDYERIQGFNENFRGWGGEDVDFYDRLESTGAERTVVLNIRDFIQHLDHDDESRVANHEIKVLKDSNNANGLIAHTNPVWNKARYNLLKADGKIVFLRRLL